MTGIDTARFLYENYGRQMLQTKFAGVLNRIAVGIAGRGSECFGFDDDVSRDHDFSPGFSLWISREDYSLFGEHLNEAYWNMVERLPEMFRPPTDRSKFGAVERGVCVIEDFFMKHTGIPGKPSCWQDWLYVPDYAFAEVTNGAVFRDDVGRFSAIRNAILNDMPRDVLLKKLAARSIAMAQSGQYNFPRCHKHGEFAAAQLALSDFVQRAVSVVFLLNGQFSPYYKWAFRALRRLPDNQEEALAFLLTENAPVEVKNNIVEDVCANLVKKMSAKTGTELHGNYLEDIAVQLTGHIENAEIKSLHIMEGA